MREYACHRDYLFNIMIFPVFAKRRATLRATLQEQQILLLRFLQPLCKCRQSPDHGEAKHQNIHTGSGSVNGSGDPVVNCISDGCHQQNEYNHHSNRNFHKTSS